MNTRPKIYGCCRGKRTKDTCVELSRDGFASFLWAALVYPKTKTDFREGQTDEG